MSYSQYHEDIFLINLNAAVYFDQRSLGEIAKSIGYTEANFERILNGKVFPNMPSQTAIAAVLFGKPQRHLLFEFLGRDEIAKMVRTKQGKTFSETEDKDMKKAEFHKKPLKMRVLGWLVENFTMLAAGYMVFGICMFLIAMIVRIWK